MLPFPTTNASKKKFYHHLIDQLTDASVLWDVETSRVSQADYFKFLCSVFGLKQVHHAGIENC